MDAMQPSIVVVVAVHQIEGAGFDRQIVQQSAVPRFCAGNPQKTGNVSPQIQQRVEFDGSLLPLRVGPRKQLQTQLDHGRVERIGGVLQLDAKIVGRVQGPRPLDEGQPQVAIDLPVARSVGVGQGAAHDRPAKPGVVKLVADGPQTDLQVAKALASGQLRERHGQKLIATRETSDPPMSLISSHARIENPPREKLEQLRKHHLTLVHDLPPSCWNQQKGWSRKPSQLKSCAPWIDDETQNSCVFAS